MGSTTAASRYQRHVLLTWQGSPAPSAAGWRWEASRAWCSPAMVRAAAPWDPGGPALSRACCVSVSLFVLTTHWTNAITIVPRVFAATNSRRSGGPGRSDDPALTPRTARQTARASGLPPPRPAGIRTCSPATRPLSSSFKRTREARRA